MFMILLLAKRPGVGTLICCCSVAVNFSLVADIIVSDIINATEERFIYIGPTTNTGLVENTIFTGNRETVEKYLEPTIEKLPQVRLLIVATESLAVCKPKVKTAGTLLNKYYNDVLSLMRKPKED